MAGIMLYRLYLRQIKSFGVITLYRNIGKDNFKYDDIFLLDMLKEHLHLDLTKKKRVEK